MEPILIQGEWRPAEHEGSFCAFDPATRTPLPHRYPVSSWSDCERALAAAAAAATAMESQPPTVVAGFLEEFAARLEEHGAALCEVAALETGLPLQSRLINVELPRTTRQLRQAAVAAREGSWRLATIDTANDIRSAYGPLGPVLVFGPNNFPLAFNGVAGGDFAAALAAGNPLIAKANPAHPHTTQLLAEHASATVRSCGLPAGAVQMLYRMSCENGLRMAADPRIGAVAFTGSRSGGMALKAAADTAGKPIYLEMSSVNPVFLLPGAIAERRTQLVEELAGSCLLASGQFCTCPNLFVLFGDDEAEVFLTELAQQFTSRPPGVLLSEGVQETLRLTVGSLRQAGAELVVGGQPETLAVGYSFQNTLLCVSGAKFLADPHALQTEAFGNATLAVVVSGIEQACQVASHIEGSLTGSIYSASNGRDDALYEAISPIVRRRVGRLLNDRMPTGVVLSPAMNHGGPFPATGHPGFTAVGIPASIRRFAMLQCFDHVRPNRLPPWLRDEPPQGAMWRLIDGQWSKGRAGK